MKKILAKIFTDNMVICRNKAFRIWGEVCTGQEISVTFNSVTLSTNASENGHWELIFPPMSASDNLTLTATCCNETVVLKNIAIGEVWLAGGQSNMEFELSRCTDWPRIDKDRCDRVRFFYTPKFPYISDEYHQAWDDVSWELSDSNTFGNWSAIGYMYAEELTRRLGVTVGIIGCNWGGTSASCWMSREAVLASDDTRIYIDEFDERNAGISLDEQRKAFDDYVILEKDWNEKCAALYTENPSIDWDTVQELIGTCQWPGPINSFNQFRPCGQYEQMIKAVCPYTLRGFIYYQGENDDMRANSYATLLTNLINLWRKDWMDDELEFIFTQLPMHRYIGAEDIKNWPLVREAQMKVYKTVPHTGLTVIPDCGQYNDIHPIDKRLVALRMAWQALYNVYGIMSEAEACGPIYDHKTIDGNRLILHFARAERGLYLKDNPVNFEIAGEDGVFYDATVAVKENTVTLTSDYVANPIYARYCWYNYCSVPLFGMNGIPVAPFRTDEI